MPADWDDWQLEEEPPVDPFLQEIMDRLFDQCVAQDGPNLQP